MGRYRGTADAGGVKEADEVRSWIERANARGISHIFTDKTPKDKLTAEYLQLSCWIGGMRSTFDVDIMKWRRPERDPPDFEVCIDGVWKGVEITEFVDGNFLKTVALKRLENETFNAYQGEGFAAAQWNETKFLDHLSSLLSKKSESMRKRAVQIDILAIVTGEPWLDREQVRKWLLYFTDELGEMSFGQVYFVMDYDPSPPKGYPTFRLV